MTWLRILVCSLLWLPAYFAMTALWILGHPVCLLLGLARRTATRREPLSGNDYLVVWSPRWAWLWSNSEDHVSGPRVVPPTSPSAREWWERTQRWPFWRRAWSWSAWRNPVANERMLYGPAHPDSIEWLGNSPHPHEQWKLDRSPRWLWHWARHGLRTGLWILRAHRDGTYSQIRIGWKIIPAPARNAERYAGLGLQFHRHRRGAA